MIKEKSSRNVTAEDIRTMSKEEKLKAVDFFVEASSNEASNLWAQWYYYPTKNNTMDPSDRMPLEWEQDGMGFLETIGYIKGDKDLPVSLCFSFALINNKYVCFYEATSRFVDYTMVDEWVTKNYPVKYDNGTRFAKTNAANFSNCYWFCRDGK